MDRETGKTTEQFKTEYRQPPNGLYTTYANNFAIGQTVFDMRIMFGQLLNVDTDKKTVYIQQDVQINLSWLEAKALAQALAVYIQNYEAQYGAIKTEFAPLKNPTMPAVPRILAATEKPKQ